MVSIFAAETVVGRVAWTIHQSNATVVHIISVRSKYIEVASRWTKNRAKICEGKVDYVLQRSPSLWRDQDVTIDEDAWGNPFVGAIGVSVVSSSLSRKECFPPFEMTLLTHKSFGGL
jgi:hypothetical protein